MKEVNYRILVLIPGTWHRYQVLIPGTDILGIDILGTWYLVRDE